MFELTNCLDDQKVRCAAFMLQEDAELWWQSTHEIISPEQGVFSWAEFKDVFMEEYYPKDAQLRNWQEFTQLYQRGRSVTTYSKEFTRMKCFFSKLINTNYRMAQRFVLGLDNKIHRTIEAITPTTYVAALRALKVMEEVDESREPPPPTVGQMRHHD